MQRNESSLNAIAHNGSGLNAVIKKDLENETSITAQMVNRITTLHHKHNGFFNYCRLSPLLCEGCFHYTSFGAKEKRKTIFLGRVFYV